MYTVRKSTETKKKKKLKASKQTGTDIQYPVSASYKTEEAKEAPAEKIEKKVLDQPFESLLAFPGAGEVSLFKNKNY